MSEEYLQKQLTNYLNTIEELRAENERLKAERTATYATTMLQEIATLQAKLKVCREALEKIAGSFIAGELPTSEWSFGNSDDVFSDGERVGAHYQAEIAKQALQQLEGKGE